MDIRITDAELESAFAPAIRREVTRDDPDWTEATGRAEKKSRPSPLKAIRNYFSPRSESAVADIYGERWSSQDALARLDPSQGKSIPLVWRNRQFFAHGKGTKRVQLLYLMRIVEALKPSRVLEIGSGMGQNLMMLAALFPETRFTGIELTKQGYEASLALKARSEFPPELVRFSPLPLRDLSSHRRIDLHCGSAAELPFGDHSFDLVYSIQAIEQMNAVKGQVFAEITRVCSGHVVMVEPFADWNQDQRRRERVTERQQFDSSMSDLARYHLKPIYSSDDMPTKSNFGVGIVVAAVTL